MSTTYNFTSDHQDELIDALNDHEETIEDTTFIIKSYRADEVSKFTVPRIYVNFISDNEPIRRFVGNILGHYPDTTITQGTTEITVKGEPILGYPVKTTAEIMVVCHEKKAHGFDANKLVRNTMDSLVKKIHKEWPAILKQFKGKLEGPIGPYIAEPFFVGSEKVYSYTARFDIIHTFVWTEQDEETDGTGYICEISGSLYDRSNKEIQEFTTNR